MTSRGFAITSVIALVVAVVATVAGHLGLGPTYDPLTLTLSDYALSSHGAAIELAMVALSGGTLALLGGLVTTRVPVRGLPAALMLVWVFGLIVSAVVPTDPIGTPVMSTAATVHRYASVVAFVALPAAVFFLARRLRAREVIGWGSLVPLLRRLAAVSAVGLVGLWYVAFPGDRVMMGLVERGLVGVEVVILFVLALRLMRITARPRTAVIPVSPAPAGAARSADRERVMVDLAS
jgi:hypothetical protein